MEILVLRRFEARWLPTFFRRAAYRTGSHLRLLPVGQGNRAQDAGGIGQRDCERHRLAVDVSGEPGWMNNSAIDRIGVDVVGPNRLEAAVRVGADGARRIAECAADVHMNVGVVDD